MPIRNPAHKQTSRKSFFHHCQEAYDRAVESAKPFVPSEADLQEAYAPLTQALLESDLEQTKTWIQESLTHNGPRPEIVRGIGYLRMGLQIRREQLQKTIDAHIKHLDAVLPRRTYI